MKERQNFQNYAHSLIYLPHCKGKTVSKSDEKLLSKPFFGNEVYSKPWFIRTCISMQTKGRFMGMNI